MCKVDDEGNHYLARPSEQTFLAEDLAIDFNLRY